MKKRSLLAGACFALVLPAVAHAQSKTFAQDEVDRGRYLAAAGDCAACHTAPGDNKPIMAGGYPIASPIGTIFSTNITPSRTHGIGSYTEAQFAQALREGVRADGTHLYPAMPYSAYAGVSDADVHALYAYFMQGVTPVDTSPPRTKLPFPFNIRSAMIGWNALFADQKRVSDDPAHDAQWNRGRYLTETLGHCADCHTPRGFAMQTQSGKSLSGASLGAWYAPNITSDKVGGIGGWSTAEIAQYLATGHVSGKAQAAGPMAEVITNSTSQLTQADLTAIASYLLTVPGTREPLASYAIGKPAAFEVSLRGSLAPSSDGARLYSGLCASCHGSSGAGTPDGVLPSLFHNSTVGATRADNLVAVILNGVDRRIGDEHVLMPGFGKESFVQSLSDKQVADVATFVRQTFGPGDAVTEDQVATARKGGPSSNILLLARGGLAAAAAILFAAAFLVLRRRARRAA